MAKHRSRPSKNRKDRWVLWTELCDMRPQLSQQDVIIYLRAKGYLLPDEFYPTQEAFRCNYARLCNRKPLWDKFRFTREIRLVRKQIAQEGTANAF